VLKPQSDLSTRARCEPEQKHGEFVAPEPRQHIHARQLSFMRSATPAIQVSDLVAIYIIDLFELVEVDVNQSEDAGLLPRLRDLHIQILVPARIGCECR